jgi:DNA-binding NarL/FixJ family response regulator/predicted transcriptional regulator
MHDLSPLDLPGVDPLGERAYLAVLAAGRAPVPELAARIGLEQSEATALLEALRSAGLVTRLESATPEYSAVDPRVAVRALVDGLVDRSERLRSAIPTLAEQFEAGVDEAADAGLGDIVTDPDAVAAWYARLQHQAQREFLAFDRPPYVGASFDPFESAVLARGVRWRAVYTVASFDEGATWAEVEELAAQGEEARITDDLPVKLVVVDGHTALVSLTLEPGRVAALVTTAPPLVDALRRLFLHEWERATPLPDAAPLAAEGGGRRFPAARGRQPTPDERAMIALMSVGMKDDGIARRLGISTRTLRRRSQELLVELGAGNRFQAGVEAARRGWV